MTAAGNMLNDGSFSYTWDAESRLKGAAGVTYTYDGDGRRVKKSNGKLYWYDQQGNITTETDLAGNNSTEYIFLGGRRVARRDSVGAVAYYFANHLGSTSVMTNSVGTIVDESDYYPFGGERTVVNNDPNPYKFTGKERDSESGLDYFGARYYASSLGRFTSSDPSGVSIEPSDPQTWNRFSYTLNKPLAYTDPNGKWWKKEHDLIIDEVFRKLLNGKERDILKSASEVMDFDQSQEGAYKHGMSAAYYLNADQDPFGAFAQSLGFIDGKIQDAVRAQLDFEEGDGRGNSYYALYLFGEALHTATDNTSLQHRGGQRWHALGNPLADLQGGIHAIREGVHVGMSDAEARHEARVQANRLWLQYQQQLAAEKKKKEEEKAKKESKGS